MGNSDRVVPEAGFSIRYLELTEGLSFLQKRETSLPGVLELYPKVHSDARGFFMETYHQEKFAGLGIGVTFVQDSQSCSTKGTLRGLHYQLHHPQAKLCRVIQGEALDVAVDIRVGSPHFAKSASVILSSEMRNQVFIPAGFAHGILALTETVQFLYKCSDFYDPSDEYGIIWNDPAIGIRWNVSTPKLSERDARFPRLSEIEPQLLPRFDQP